LRAATETGGAEEFRLEAKEVVSMRRIKLVLVLVAMVAVLVASAPAAKADVNFRPCFPFCQNNNFFDNNHNNKNFFACNNNNRTQTFGKKANKKTFLQRHPGAESGRC
jgi:hypothetical protein